MTKPAANTIESRAKPYLKRIEQLFADLDSEKGSYMAAAKALREDIRSVFSEAKEAGIQVKALRGLVKWRQLEKKQNAIADGLDIDESAAYSQLVEALGPLGQAAADRAGYKAEEGDISKLGRGPQPAAH